MPSLNTIAMRQFLSRISPAIVEPTIQGYKFSRAIPVLPSRERNIQRTNNWQERKEAAIEQLKDRIDAEMRDAKPLAPRFKR